MNDKQADRREGTMRKLVIFSAVSFTAAIICAQTSANAGLSCVDHLDGTGQWTRSADAWVPGSALCIDEDAVNRANDGVGEGSYITREDELPGGVKETVSRITWTVKFKCRTGYGGVYCY